MKQEKRHATNELYRLVVDKLGADTVRLEQEQNTGKKVSDATVRRYYNGYGEYQAIPQPAYEAALRLTSAMFLVATNLSKTLNQVSGMVRRRNAA